MTSTQNKPNTPGFNCRVEVEFKTDRNGRPYAQQWNRKCRRWVRCNADDARMWLAQDLADRA